MSETFSKPFEATSTRRAADWYRQHARFLRTQGRSQEADGVDRAVVQFEAQALELEREYSEAS